MVRSAGFSQVGIELLELTSAVAVKPVLREILLHACLGASAMLFRI